MAVDSSADLLYAVLATTAVTITNQDNDVPPIYLPLILRNFVTAPDLVITSLSKDYERSTTASSEAMVYIASIHTLLKRLAPAF